MHPCFKGVTTLVLHPEVSVTSSACPSCSPGLQRFPISDLFTLFWALMNIVEPPSLRSEVIELVKLSPDALHSGAVLLTAGIMGK